MPILPEILMHVCILSLIDGKLVHNY